MNDEAPSTGAPDPKGTGPTPPAPPPFEPNKTVMRPIDADPVEPATPAAPAASAADNSGNDDLATFGGFAADPPAGSDGPIDAEFPTKASKAGITGAIVAVGTGLLGAAVAIAAARSRMDGDLDWSNYGVGLGATAVLLLVAVLGAVTAGRRTGGRAREEVITWPGVVGIVSSVVLLNVGLDTQADWLEYFSGAALVVLAVIGYVAARRAAFVVVAIAGLAILYGLVFDDFVADSVDGGSDQVLFAVLLAIFVAAVTVLGWALPSRAVTGVVVGVAGVAGFIGIMVSFLVARYLGEFLGSMFGGMGGPLSDDGSDGGGFATGDFGFAEKDVWLVLGLAAALTALWAFAAAVSNHPGFSILAIVMLAAVVPLASFALATEHPTWWAAIVASGGGILLLGGTGLARLRGKSVARTVSHQSPQSSP